MSEENERVNRDRKFARRYVWIAWTLLLATAAQPLRSQLPASPPSAFEDDASPQYILIATGTQFSLAPSTDTAVMLRTSEPISLNMESLPRIIHLVIEPLADASKATATFSQLRPNATYYRFQDGFSQPPLVTDAFGTTSYEHDISTTHAVSLLLDKHTIFITPSGAISPPTAPIKIMFGQYVQTGNITESLVIQRSNITFNGGGFRIVGPGSGVGITISGLQDVTLQNVNVSNFTQGVFITNSNFFGAVAVQSSNISDNITHGINVMASKFPAISFNTLSGNGRNGHAILVNGGQGGWIGFNTITGGALFGAFQVVGAEVAFTNNATVTNNQFSRLSTGLYVTGNRTKNFSKVTNNTFDTTGRAIEVVGSWENEVTGNTIRNSPLGVGVRASMGGNLIKGNSFQKLSQGINLRNTRDFFFIPGRGNTVENNTISQCSSGVFLEFAENERILNNTITGGAWGVHLEQGSVKNIISTNTISDADAGIRFSSNFGFGAPNVGNIVVGNTVQRSRTTGVLFDNAAQSGNVIYHNNFIASGVPVRINGSANVWDAGYPGSGNNWSHLTNADASYGPSQNFPVSDGRADAGYVIDANNRDRYPFMQPSGWLVDTMPPMPVLNLNAAPPISGTVNLSWFPPGNDWDQGTASSYELRIAAAPLNEGNFSAGDLRSMPVPVAPTNPATSQNAPNILLKTASGRNYIAMKTKDAAGKVSSLSNIVVVDPTAAQPISYIVQSPEATPVVTLESTVLGMRLVPASTTDAGVVFTLLDSGGYIAAGPVYHLSPDNTVFPSPATITMLLPPNPDPSIEIVKVSGGAIVPGGVTGQVTAAAAISGKIASASFYVLARRPADVLPPRTAMNVGQPRFGGPPPFVTSATPFSLTAVDDGQVAGDGTGVGVAQTRYSIDNGSLASYAAPFAIAGAGMHAIRFFSADLNGNVEIVQTSTVAVDNAPPNTALAFVGGRQASGTNASTFFASSDTRVSLAAVDPLVNGVASGVAFTRFQDNGGAFQNFNSAFGLAEGSHALTYQSQDNVGNLEPAKATTVLIDAAPPASTATIGSPLFVAADGTRYIAPATPITLSAQDPTVNGAASGLDRIEAAVDGAGFAAYSSALTFAEGRHTILFRSVDRVGNVEAVQTLQVQSDATPPATSLQPSGTFFISTGQSFAPASFTYTLAAQDPATGAVASGIAFTRYQDNGGTFQTFSAPFNLAEGVHSLVFQSRDNAGNLELLKSATVFVDATAPVTAVAIGSPSSGTVIAPMTPISFTATDPLVSGVASGVDHIEVNVDSRGFTPYTTALTLSAGAHTLAFRSVDHAGNVEASRSLSLSVDGVSPAISIASPLTGQTFVATKGAIPVSFSVADNLDPSPRVGAALVELQDRGSPRGGRPSVVPVNSGQLIQPLDLDDGLWRLQVSATDFALNSASASSGVFEVVHDTLAPRTSIAVGNPQAAGASGLFVTRMTSFSLTSIDDLVLSNDGIGLGVSLQQLAVDGAPRAPFVNPASASGQVFFSSFSLSVDADGLRVLAFSARDVLGNAESAHTATVAVDNTAPQTALSLTGGSQVSGDAAGFYASSGTLFAFATVDPVVNGVASGAAFTRFRDNGGAFQIFVSAFSLPEGSHNLGYQSEDRVQNLEVIRSTTVLIDATPPVTAAQVGVPLYTTPDGTSYITPTTPVTFTARDPISSGVASGVTRIEVAVDGGAFAAYSSALILPEGAHTISFRAIDNVINAEVFHSLSVRSDNTPPVTTVHLGAPLYVAPDGTNYIAPATPISFSAVDPLVSNVASGAQRVEVSVDGGPFAPRTTPLTLAEGRHTVVYRAVDNVGNVETARTLNVRSDAAAPVSAAEVGSPSFTADDGTRYMTPTTPVTFSATDPLVASVVSGLDRIEVNIDSAGYVSYGGALFFAAGRHTVLFRAVDKVGNVEAERSLALRSDATAPVTALSASGSFFTAQARDYAPASFTYSLSATDPEVNGAASGVASIRYGTGGPFQDFSSAFSLAEGVRKVDYQSQDNVGNLEALKSASIHVDATAPTSSLTIGSPSFDPGAGGAVFIAPATRLSLTAVDPLSGGVASGLRLVSFRRGTDPFMIYMSSFGLAAPDGLKTVEFHAEDSVGNREAVRSRTFVLDGTAPATSLALQGGRQHPGPDAASFYASSDTRLTLPAADPGADGFASGVSVTEYQDNTGPLQSFAAAFSLAEGRHALSYRSRDRVENLEVLRSTSVLIDATPPVTTAQIGSPLYTAADGINYVTPATPVTFSAVDPALPTGEPGSGLARIEVSVDGGPFVTYTAALSFAEGRHALLYRAADRVANTETARSLHIQSDGMTPQTMLAVLSRQTPAGPNSFYAAGETRFKLTAVDPEVKSVASGVAFTRFQDNGGAFQTYAAEFTFGEGTHVIGYQSQDNVGHLEALRSATALIDATAPRTTVSIGSPLFTAADGTKYVTPRTPLTFSADDPVVGGIASGVDRIEVAIDGGAFARYDSALTFPEGPHTILYRALDRVGNVEATRQLDLRSDDTRPVTTFTPSGALFTAGERSYASASLTYSLPARDPIVNNVAAGVALTRYRTSQGAYQDFASAFGLSEGVRLVKFHSQDNVGNVELLQSATVFVDATSPVSALAIGSPKFDPGSGQPVFVAAATLLTLNALDPVAQEVASGVRQISFRRGGDAFAPYAAPFSLPLPDGLKSVDFFAADNVSNTEASRSAALALDNTAPITSLAILGGRQFAGPDAASFYASADTRFGLPAADPVAGGVASGLALTQHQDNGGAFQVFTAAFGLSEGAHLLGYRSQDRVQNMEVLRSTTALIDATAPASSAMVASPRFIAANGTIYITPETPITLSAADPALATGQPGSGVSRIEVAVDGGAFRSYGGALLLAEGLHTILFKAVDNVVNVEAVHTLLVRSDATPPLTSLALAGGRQAAGPAAGTFYASADTSYALRAVDPVVNGVASGIAFTRYQDNSGSVQNFTAAFLLTEGSHALGYQSQDNVGHLEVLRSTTALVDATAPVSAAVIGSPLFVSGGVNYVTPATSVTLSAVDPESNGVASGVDRIEVAVDGGVFAAYASALHFPEGRHTILYRALDRVGNVEATRRLEIQSDDTPPLTAFSPSGALFTAAGRSYAPAQFSYSLPAHDPVVGNVASGVALTRYRTAPGAYQVFAAPFSLSEGVRRVEFQSQDNVGNVELLKSATVFVDATSPVSALAIGNPKFNAGAGQPVFVAAKTPLTLTASDPEVQEAASGVRQISFRRGADAFESYVAPFTLPTSDGLTTVEFFAADNVDNRETIRTAALALDDTAPITSLAVLGGRQFAGPDAASFYASSDTRFALPAADPLAGGVASGLALTQYQDDGGASQTFVSPFGLSEGAHALSYRSQDRVLNLEVLRSTTALIDATAPASSATVASPRFIASDGTIYITPATPVTMSAADPALPSGQTGSGVSRIEVAIDGGTFSPYGAALTFVEGRHTILFRATDNVGNVETIRTLSVQSDATPPLTQLAVIGGKQASSLSDSTFYASLDTRYALPAADPVVNGVASGLESTRYQDNGGTFVTLAAPFSLAEGSHALGYRSQDNVRNMEVLRSTTVLVDATAPVSSATIGSPLFVGADGMRYITPATPLTLSAFDTVSNGVASGVDRIEIAVDGGAFAAYASALTFAEGRHTVVFRAFDRVGNVEATHRLDLQSDDTQPVTTFTPSGALFTAGERSYAPADLTYSLPARDPIVNNVASGVAFTRYRTSQGAYQDFASAFSLSEGVRLIEFQSHDNVRNVELLKSTTVFVDATSPLSAFAIGEPKHDPGDGRPVFVAAATPLTLSAQDPLVQEVAAGVRDISFRRDGGSFGTYSAPFTLPLPDGVKTVAYFATDNVGNAEVARSASVALDDTAPLTALTVLGGRQFPGPSAGSFYASADTRLALPAADPAVNGVASGLALTRWQDNGGAFQAFSAAVALPEGSHALGYQSQDRVQNMEVPRSTTVLVDATPPVTTARIEAPLFVAADGTNYISPATPVTFAAVDPAVQGVASGVNGIEVAVDGGAFAPYSAALTFAEGRHTVLYRAIDNVANVEAVRTLSVQSDATPPSSSLAIGAPSFDPGAGQPMIVASATLLTLSAQDPVVENVASGVRQVSFRRGGDAFSAYTAPFTLQLPDGIKTLDYLATDNVGNLEATRSTTVALDNTPPLTTLAVLGGRQFPGPDAASFYASSDTRLALPAADPVVNAVASGLAFTRWQDNGGAFQAFGVAFGLPEGRHLVVFQSQDRVQNTEVLRSTTVLVDATAPVSLATIGSPVFVAADGTNYIMPATPVTLSAVDPSLPTGQPGSGLSRIEVAIDGGPFAVYSTALTFAEGRHTILYRAIDNVANVETIRTLQVRSDATTPASSLVVGQPRFQLPDTLLVSARTPFEVAAVDPVSNDVASGVKDSFYRVSDLVSGGAAFQTFSAPFRMGGADVSKVIEFYSRDNVLNTEIAKSSTVLLDSTAPEVALLSPASCDEGICRVVTGRFPVLGTARDIHFTSYVLEAAAGKDAATGFALISSGTIAVSSGALGVWDTATLAGWQTLRLTGADQVQNTAATVLNVFVGDPAALLVLGGHKTFNMPEGVAVGGGGNIYVADRNNHRVAVFSSTGALLASFGGRGRDEDDDDNQPRSTSTLRLTRPSAVAVDAAGSIFVADTENHRVLKLSPAGEVLLDIGRRKIEREEEGEATLKFEHMPGKEPGQFKKPSGIAVDAAGRIYVSDTGNHRVQVFSSTGAFALAFALPPAQRIDGDDEPSGKTKDDDDDDQPELGTPVGIALDSAANIYVADSKGSRALVFDAAGRLLTTVPVSGREPGKRAWPVGIAVSPSGNCLLVSDHKSSRVLKYDFQGNLNLLFGGKGREQEDDKRGRLVSSIRLRKPSGLALDASGALFVADRNNEQIKKFSLPDGSATVFVPPQRSDEDDSIAHEVIDQEEGGHVERGDRAGVSIPAGALAEDLKITVSTPAVAGTDESDRDRDRDDQNLKVVSAPVEYGPEGTKFNEPVILTLPYTLDLIAAQGLSEDSLKINYWNKEKGKWEALESEVDKKSGTVKAKTPHFSLYQVLGSTGVSAAIAPLAADVSFGLKDMYAFPNPVRGQGPVTIRVQPGLADSITVRVYDVSGRKVHESSNFSNRGAFDDGNGKGQQFTYDHIWDVSGIGSGVYTFVVTAAKSGERDIHKAGKVGIIK